MFFHFDPYYFLLVVPALLLAMVAQARVSSTFSKYNKVRASSGMTGADVARRILDSNGLSHIRVESVAGNLTDHYDPTAGVIRLSQSVHSNASIASIGVAAHEAGHAVQHSLGYFPLKVRNAIIPVTNFGSKLSMPLILFGMISGNQYLLNIGILAFGLMAVFQLVTLPVEFNASSRALATVYSDNILRDGEELEGAKKVLSAAALTYVAALIVSVAQLLRLVILFGGRRDD